MSHFSIEVDRKFKREGNLSADFFNCVYFGKQAKFVEKYLHKGIKIVISGRIQNDSYINRDRQAVYSVCIMVEVIDSAESKNAADWK